jgi:hypothetical protein
MEYIEEQEPPEVITSDTENATKIHPEDAADSKQAKFRRFRAYNTGMWNGPRRENTKQFNRQDDLHRYDSIATSAGLTKRQKKQGREILDDFDSHHFGQSIDHIIFGICVVVANADVHDGSRYWPSHPNLSSIKTCDEDFESLADSLNFNWREQMSAIKKVQSRTDV